MSCCRWLVAAVRPAGLASRAGMSRPHFAGTSVWPAAAVRACTLGQAASIVPAPPTRSQSSATAATVRPPAGAAAACTRRSTAVACMLKASWWSREPCQRPRAVCERCHPEPRRCQIVVAGTSHSAAKSAAMVGSSAA
eukprot:2016074-Lingulodinium_polyedra.AAC.1